MFTFNVRIERLYRYLTEGKRFRVRVSDMFTTWRDSTSTREKVRDSGLGCQTCSPHGETLQVPERR